MLENIEISIIVPVFNMAAYLEQCLNSLLNQTISSKEIIIINDGSTDNSTEICRNYQKCHKNIHLIEQNNQGVAAAQQTGLKVAKGRYIAFVGADDFLAPEMYAKMLETAYETSADVVECNHCCFWENGKKHKGHQAPYEEMLKKNHWNLLGSGAEPILFSIGYAWRIHKNSFLKKYFFNFRTDIRFGEDFIWHFFPPLLSEHFAFIDYCGYYYRQRQIGNQTNSASEKLLDIFKSFQQADLYRPFLQSGKAQKYYWVYESKIAVFISNKLDAQAKMFFWNRLNNRWNIFSPQLPPLITLVFFQQGNWRFIICDFLKNLLLKRFITSIQRKQYTKTEKTLTYITFLSEGNTVKRFFHKKSSL